MDNLASKYMRRRCKYSTASTDFKTRHTKTKLLKATTKIISLKEVKGDNIKVELHFKTSVKKMDKR